MHHAEEYELDINEVEHFKNIMKKLNLMRKERKNCDLIISVEDKTIHVNRNVVCAASDYFDAMFSHDTIEKQEGIVEMKDIQYTAVEKCIDFIYTGKLSIYVDQCDEILFSANLIQLDEICKKIHQFLQSHLDIDTFFDIRTIALKFSIKPLLAFCDEFAISNISLLSKVDEFNHIDVGYLNTLISLNVSTACIMEDAKLAIVVQWINFEQDNRLTYLTEFLTQIDFSKLTPAYCKYLVDEEPLCIVSGDFVRVLSSAVDTREGISVDDRNGTVPLANNYNPCANALVIFDEQEQEVMTYFPSNSQYKKAADYHDLMPERNFVACVSGSNVYVFTNRREVFHFDIDNPKWIQGPRMLHSHGFVLRSVIHNGSVYVGGENSLEQWDLQEGSNWKNVDLEGHICDMTAIIGFKKGLYLIGGRTQNTQIGLKDVVRKFPGTKWRPVSSMHKVKIGANVAVYDGNIYVSSRRPVAFCDFEIYCGKENVWTILKTNKLPRAFPIHVANNQMFSVGNNKIKVYDPNKNSWSDVESCPVKSVWVQATTTASLPVSI